MTVELFEVGGCVRDGLLGVPTKDIDYIAVASSYAEMSDHLRSLGFEVFVESPEFLTMRARFPKHLTDFGGRQVAGLTADFVLARKEGSYYDGRHPETVEPGTLEDDLRRRDFTVNALAKGRDGNVIDLFGGREDLANRILRTVGDVEDRFGEDYLRALRAVRFAITKGMAFDGAVADALRSEWVAEGLSRVSVERRREDLLRAFKADSFETIKLLHLLGDAFLEACLSDGLWLMPTLRGGVS